MLINLNLNFLIRSCCFMKNPLLFLGLIILCYRVTGQDFTEKKVIPLEFSQGLISAPGSPELYVGQITVSPQFRLGGPLRAGITAGGFYTARRLSGLAGPRIALKVVQLPKLFTAETGNLHVSADYLFGTGGQQLLGGGIHADIAELLILSLNYRRDLHTPANWFQFGIAYHLSRAKIPTDIRSNPVDIR